MSLQFPDVDEELVKRIVDQLKSQGIFDNFRKDCIADVDSRPAYHNLRDNVNRVVADFLAKQPWKDDLNKNKVRESIRKHVEQQNYLETGVNRIVEQVVNPKIFSVFMPKVEDIVYNVMGIEKPLNSDDRRHNRLRMLLSNMPPPSPADTLAEMLPSDLDPVSPGSINESGNESANLNDSITSKIIDEVDNVSRDLNKESNLDAMDGSNDSKLSGISDLSSHGSTTKLDISESAHLPDDKTEINCVGSQGMKNNIDDGDKSKQDANEPSTAGGFDFDNFSNLKEKLMKTDPLNKNIDKDRFDAIVTSTPILESESDVKDSPEINTVISELKDFKEDSMSASANTEERLDKNQIKSPVSCMYSEDSMTSISSQKSKIKLEKINSLNESTRNSLMDIEESSVSYMDKKFNQIKEHETVSCIESMKEESQASILSTGSKKSNSFAILNVINENSRDVSEISSPDITKNSFDDKKKDKKSSSQRSSSKSERSSQHRSRDTSKDGKYSKDKKSSDDKSLERSRYDGKDKSRDSSRKESSNNRDKYSSRSKDEKYRSDKEKSRKYEDSKDRDSRKNSQQDDKNKKDSKLNTDDEKKSSNKDSLNSSDDDKNKDRKKDEKSSKDDKKSTKKDESRKTSDYKSEKDLKNNEEQKSSKSKDKHSTDDHRPSSSKDKESKSCSDDDKHSKKDKDMKKTDSKDLKNSSSKDKESKSSSRKSSSVKDVKNGEDEKYSKRDKDSKYSEVTKDKNLKLNSEYGKVNKSNNKESSIKSKDKPSGDNKQEGTDKDKRKTSSSDVTSKKDDKKDDKSSRKRRRENCSEETEKRDHRRSRDRDDGGSKNTGRKIEERKDDKKSRSSSNKQDKNTSSSKKSSKEPTDKNEPSDIDLILERIGTSIREDEMKNMTSDEQCGVDSDQKEFESTSNGFNTLKKPKIANNMFEISKIMNARKDYQKKIEESEIVQGVEKDEEQHNDLPLNDDNNKQNSSEVVKVESQKTNDIDHDEDSNDPEKFYGFNPIEIDSTRTTVINFQNNLKLIYGSDFTLNILFNDKYFSITDKNLNNINFKNVTNLISDCHINDTLVCTSLTTESQILSPVSKTNINGCVNESDENLDDSNVLNSTSDCVKTKMKIPEIIDEKLKMKSAVNSQDNTSKIVDSTLENQPGKQGADDSVSLNECSSSELTFSLPPLTEDMLDNFMKENILNKSEDCYASSESEIEDSTSNASLVPETCAESTNKIGNYKLPELPQPKEKTNLQRGSQRYDSRDLYKPRPLFSNSSRRNRVLNKNDSELARGTKRSSDSMEFSENKKPRFRSSGDDRFKVDDDCNVFASAVGGIRGSGTS